MKNIDLFKANSPRSKGLKEVLRNWDEQISDFEFKYVNKDVSYPTKPTEPSFYIKDVKEKAYQRAFFQQTRIVVANLTDFLPLDMEIPVFRGESSRRDSLDMIGQSQDGDLVLSELKAIGGTSPVWGIWELIKYGKSIVENRKNLSTHPGFTFEDKYVPIKSNYWIADTKLKYLLLVAPMEYWEMWWSYLPKFQALGDSLVEKYELNALLKFVSCPTIDFSKQKGANLKYWPKTEFNQWEVLSYESNSSPRR